MSQYKSKAKFEGNTPLIKSIKVYPQKFYLKYNKFEVPKEFSLMEAWSGSKIELGNRKITFGIKAPPSEFTKYDFLWCPDGGAFVVHQRVLDKFNELCPNDIQALPMTIKNLNPQDEPFECREFWLVNILAKVSAFDENYLFKRGKSLTFRRVVIKENCMENHLIARDPIFGPKILFDPSLAKHFIKSKGIHFLTGEEATLISGTPTMLWYYLNRHYGQTLIDLGIYDEFYDHYKYEEEASILQLVEKYPNKIFLNLCPSCGNIKKTPQARQCLECGIFTDPKI